MLKLHYKPCILVVLWSCHLCPFYCEDGSDVHKGNQTNHVRKKPYRYVSSLPDLQLPDVHFTFPPFDTQVAAAKREIDLSSNSIIRYTPVHEKHPVPTASNQHFEKILNKIKSFKHKLKNHRRLTTPLYSPVSADPLPITPIAVPAYDYFPVGPDYLHQYLQISHKYDMLSCIYLKISEDSFMKVQCYPILPHTDQVETYSTNYNNGDLSNPDVANVYHTLVPNAHKSYPQESLYDFELLGTTIQPHVPYSNAYYFHGNLNPHSTKAGYTPHPLPAHSAPSPPTLSSSVAPSIKYVKPHNFFHFNKTSLPLPVSFPSSNGLHGNFTDKKLTTLANTYEHQSNRFPADNKSEMTDNDSPTKISLLNHIIVPLDMEPTEKLDVNKLFSRPDDTVVIEASTNKYSWSSTTTDSTLIVNELYIIPRLRITHPVDKTEFTQFSAYPTKRTTFPLSESENTPPSISETRFLLHDKKLNEITEKESKNIFVANSYDTSPVTEQHVEPTNLPINVPVFQDRDYEPVEIDVVTTKHFESTTERRDQLSITTSKIDEITTSELDLRLFTSTIPGSLNTAFTKSTENQSGKMDSFKTTSVDSSPDALRPYTVDSYKTTTLNNPPDYLSELSTSTVDSYVITAQNSSPDDLRELSESSIDSLVTTTINSTPDDLRKLSESSIDTLVTTTINSTHDDLRKLSEISIDSLVTTTINSTPDDLRQLSESSFDSLVTTTINSTPDDLRQLSEISIDSLVTTTINSTPDDIRQLSEISIDSLGTTTINSTPDDLGQLSEISIDSLGTTTINSTPNDLRQLSEISIDSLLSSTIDNSLDDLRQKSTNSVDSFVTTTIDSSPNDLRQLYTTTDNGFVTTALNTSPHDLRQLSTSTVSSYVTTTVDSATDNFSQLPTSTVQSFGTTTVVNTVPDDMRQLPISAIESFVISTVHNSPDDITELRTSTIDSIGFDESYITTTVDSSTDDLRQLPISSTEDTSASTTTKNSDDLRQLETISTESSSFDIGQVPTTTFKSTLQQLSTRVVDVLPASNNKIVFTITESPYYNDLRQLSFVTTEPMNNDNLHLSTTDDSMTWFTSDLEDFSKVTIALALVRSEGPAFSSTTPTYASIVNTEKTSEMITNTKYTTSQYVEELTEKSIEDNEIPHESFTENANIELFHDNKFSTQINDSKHVNIDRKNLLYNINKTYGEDKVKLDKNNILSLSSEDIIKQGYGRKIPLDTDEGNIVKVLEKNINTGKWEVQFYKVDPNNTSLNSEDIDLPRRSDVLISDYDGYDNIDSDAEIQYEYDYRGKNTSAVDLMGNFSESSKLRSLLNYDVKESTAVVNDAERKNRRSTYNIKELDHLISSYEKLKENNSTVLSDIRDIAQNNAQNNKNTNFNVNYLDDFLKQTNKVKQYYDEKKGNQRVKRNIVIELPVKQKFLALKSDNNETSTEKTLLSDRITRQTSPNTIYMRYGTNMIRPQQKRRYMRNIPPTRITDNSETLDYNGTSEKINTNDKQFVFPEVPLKINYTRFPYVLKSFNVQKNTNDIPLNFSNVLSSNDSNELNIQTRPNTSLLKSYNGSFFDVEKIKTTTDIQTTLLNTIITEGSKNKVFIYKHENTSNVKQNELNTNANSTVKFINQTSSLEPQRNVPPGGYDTSSKVDQLKTNQILQEKLKTRNDTSTKGNYLSFFQNFKNTLKANNYSSNTEVYKNTQFNVTNNSLPMTTSQAVKIVPFKKTLITTINLMKNITTLLRKQNSSSNRPTIIDPVEKEFIPTDKTYELEFNFGKVMNATRSDVIYVPMYVEVLLMTQIMLLLVLLVFIVFLHYAGSRLSKRRQFDCSVSYLNNGFDTERIFNNLP